MVSIREMYCAHCKRIMLFFLESDGLWYCDECGNVADSEENEEEIDLEEDEEIIRCPFCDSLVSVDFWASEGKCPFCSAYLPEIMENREYDLEGEIWE